MSKYATVYNAEAIRDRTDRAASALRIAGRELKDALLLASDDYDHNADKLQQIVGAIGLLTSAVGTEHSTWVDYARERRKPDAERSGTDDRS